MVLDDVGTVVSRKGGNQGHTVEYRGDPVAWAVVGGDGGGGMQSLAHGLRGTWTLTAGGHDRGGWQLWPALTAKSGSSANQFYAPAARVAPAARAAQASAVVSATARAGWSG